MLYKLMSNKFERIDNSAYVILSAQFSKITVKLTNTKVTSSSKITESAVKRDTKLRDRGPTIWSA